MITFSYLLAHRKMRLRGGVATLLDHFRLQWIRDSSRISGRAARITHGYDKFRGRVEILLYTAGVRGTLYQEHGRPGRDHGLLQ